MESLNHTMSNQKYVNIACDEHGQRGELWNKLKNCMQDLNKHPKSFLLTQDSESNIGTQQKSVEVEVSDI